MVYDSHPTNQNYQWISACQLRPESYHQIPFTLSYTRYYFRYNCLLQIIFSLKNYVFFNGYLILLKNHYSHLSCYASCIETKFLLALLSWVEWTWKPRNYSYLDHFRSGCLWTTDNGDISSKNTCTLSNWHK